MSASDLHSGTDAALHSRDQAKVLVGERVGVQPPQSGPIGSSTASARFQAVQSHWDFRRAKSLQAVSRPRQEFPVDAPRQSGAFCQCNSRAAYSPRPTLAQMEWHPVRQPAASAFCRSYTTARLPLTACRKYLFLMQRGFTRSTGRPYSDSSASASSVQRLAGEPDAAVSSSTKKSRSLCLGWKSAPVAEPAHNLPLGPTSNQHHTTIGVTAPSIDKIAPVT